MSLAPRAKPINRAQKTGVLMASVRNIRGFAQDLLKGSAASLTLRPACDDEPVYRIARRKKNASDALEMSFNRGNFLAEVLTTRKR